MTFPIQFQHLKQDIIDSSFLAKDALHVHIGLIVFIVVRLLWRRRGGWLVAWLVTLAVASGGEWLDHLANLGSAPDLADPEHWHDIWNTMVWPTVLLFLGRWLQPHPGAKEAVPAAEGANNSSEPAAADQSAY